MCLQKKSFQVLFLTIVFSSLLVSLCLAAPKTSASLKITKVPDQIQNNGAKPPISQETIKAPDNIQNNEAKPSISQETIKVPDEIQNSETKPSIFQDFAEVYDNIIKSEPLLIIVDKSEFKLHLFKDGKIIKSYDVAIGKNPGQKQRIGDMTTPTGEFTVDEIIDSSYWTHDFNDGNGEIKGAYGPWFISLETGWNGIGIHGTHNPSSIKTMVSEGCIRMNNEEVAALKEQISIGTKVVVVSQSK